MKGDIIFFSPKTSALIYRIIGLVVYWILWIKTDFNLYGLISILLIMILMLIRWRFEKPKLTLIFDVIIY